MIVWARNWRGGRCACPNCTTGGGACQGGGERHDESGGVELHGLEEWTDGRGDGYEVGLQCVNRLVVERNSETIT